VPFAFVGYELLPGTSSTWPEEVMQADWWKPPVAAFLTARCCFPASRARELGVRPISQIAKLTGQAAAPTTWREALSDFYELTRQQAFPRLAGKLQGKLARRFESFWPRTGILPSSWPYARWKRRRSMALPMPR